MKIRTLFLTAIGATALAAPLAAQDFIAGLPREDTLIIQGPAAQNADWFNLWAPGGGASPNGNQQLSADTLWFINPEGSGDDAWQNALAASRPIYNDDFTQMTVELKDGIFWSDGEPFTAEDVVYTVETQMANPGMNWSAPFTINVESVEAPDDHTVVFNLNAPNSRFHTLFTVRWNAAWIMPEHVFSQVEDPLTATFNPPVSLSAYVLENYDANGQWAIWRLRDDWERTSIGMTLDEAPEVEYVVYRTAGNPDARVIEQLNHNLDVINDIAPEGMFTIVEQAGDTTAQWLPGFPFAHPDPTLPSVLLNNQLDKLSDPRVRWALALLIDIRAVSMGSYRGAANIAALSVPPTGSAIPDYYVPMQDWLIDYELDTGEGTIQPYNPDIAEQIAQLVTPQWGDSIPEDPELRKEMFGFGWWQQDAEAAAALLRSAGFTEQGDGWLTPEGEPFEMTLQVEGDNIPTLARAGTIIAQQWSLNGIPTEVVVAGPTHTQRLDVGDYEAAIFWTVETWGGHPDLSFFLESYHSDFLVPLGESQPPRNLNRWQNDELDAIIEENRTVPFDSPRVAELGMEYLQLAVEEMPFIPLMAYNKFAPFDTTYWTGYPSIENPYSASGPFWSNIRYMVVELEKTGG
ncbi:ABC transporter substrate-binding protein [Wenxinia saemankumensis]|uniref:Peptide/nickel transport system substrate-binding protein n=1 Tax=Wenxinia saemankumensis TaxID=1447782 RepID=A0A1M6HSM1_9RHOB|nr:ABC transporter substrate-binding protein [Wenxinia saemankumensis]SHJ25170.1 peptide/nickel transport system substrate-binding protein [Wenxinia saemankumensis]